MNPVEQIALARAYVALSNAHRVDLILATLAFSDDGFISRIDVSNR